MMAKHLHTLEEIAEAGRQLVRDNGWRPTEAQAIRLAALLRPHLNRLEPLDEPTRTAG